MKRPVFLSTFGWAVMFVTQASAADRDPVREACNKYASQAMHAVAENKSRRCHFVGNRWVTSRKNHFAWCMTKPPASRLTRETGLRVQGLHECRQRQERCKRHADTAVRAIAVALQRDRPKLQAKVGPFNSKKQKKPLCKDKTTVIVGKQMYSIWDGKSRYRHWDWCMAVGLQQARRIEALRARRLDEC